MEIPSASARSRSAACSSSVSRNVIAIAQRYHSDTGASSDFTSRTGSVNDRLVRFWERVLDLKRGGGVCSPARAIADLQADRRGHVAVEDIFVGELAGLAGEI